MRNIGNAAGFKYISQFNQKAHKCAYLHVHEMCFRIGERSQDTIDFRRANDEVGPVDEVTGYAEKYTVYFIYGAKKSSRVQLPLITTSGVHKTNKRNYNQRPASTS